ncbi:MAG: 6-phosphogluconolactonase [Hydrogeniiclostridium mannosilyticum]
MRLTPAFNNISEVPRRAITMGLKAIMQAKKIVLVANGESKAEILERALLAR